MYTQVLFSTPNILPWLVLILFVCNYWIFNNYSLFTGYILGSVQNCFVGPKTCHLNNVLDIVVYVRRAGDVREYT